MLTVDVEQAQTRYEPAIPPLERHPHPIDEEALRKGIGRDADEVARWRDVLLAARFGDTAKQTAVSAAALDQVARAYALAGHFDEARAQLEKALERAPQSARAHNNLAVALAGAGELSLPLDHIRTAVLAEPADAGLWLNLGAVNGALGDTLAGRQALEQGVAIAGGYGPACALLSLEPEGAEAGAVAAGIGPSDLRRRLHAAADAVLAHPREATSPPIMIRSRVKSLSKDDRPAAKRKLEQYLYWKS